MSVKPWQKATLSVMAGAAIYAGFLDVLTTQTQEQNKSAMEKQQKDIAREKALETTFEAKKKVLLELEKKLSSEQANTAKVNAQIKAVNEEIAQIKAGHLPSSVSIPAVTIPKSSATTSSMSNIQPPPVQSVTRASGA